MRLMNEEMSLFQEKLAWQVKINNHFAITNETVSKINGFNGHID